jgi:Fe-S-cluster containining protein
MSYLYRTAKRVEKVFSELDRQVETFQGKTGLHCVAKCNLCCMKKDLETSVLEFLPLAIYLYENNLHEQFLDELAKGREYCICLSQLKIEGKITGCSQYRHRGLICRLFGFSGLTGKNGEKKIYTCKIIKTGQEQEYKSATTRINENLKIPMASDFQMKMDQIDPILANDINPINVSIEKAISKVAYYFSNRPGRPKRFSKAG